MKKYKKYIIIAVIVLAIVGFGFYKNSQPAVSKVNKAEVVSEVVRKTVSASGSVISKNEADLSFAATGELSDLNVEKGDVVSKGQNLAGLYNYDTSQSVKASKDSRDVAKRDLELYIQTYESHKDDVGGSKEYAIGVKRLEELLSRAEAGYQSSIGTLSKTYITAPLAGTIVDILKEKGEIVGLGEAVIKIADLDNLIFEMDVDQEDFGYLKLDQQVEIELDSYTKHIFSGKVSELPKYANSSTEQFTVRIEIDKDADHTVLLGMNGDARIIVSTTGDKVNSLPFDAVFKEKNDGSYVWTEENGVLKKMPVELGLEGDIYTQVKTDLSGKQLYIPSGNEELKEGNKVMLGE
jgi:RND family efflux transporter MFP subunit